MTATEDRGGPVSRRAIERMSREAGDLLRSRFGDPGTITAKGVSDGTDRVHDLVTELDFACERLLLSRIAEQSVDAIVLAEEGGATTVDGQPYTGRLAEVDDLWLVDPLDGTINFAHGLPLFCVSVARYRFGVPVSGVVHAPMLDETYVFGPGGATLNGEPLRLDSRTRPDETLLAAGGAGAQFRELSAQFRSWRRLGSAALSLAWVSAGRFGAYVQTGRLHPWDWAAGVPLVLAAGGEVRDQDLQPWSNPLEGQSGVVCGSAGVYAAIAPTLA